MATVKIVVATAIVYISIAASINTNTVEYELLYK